MSGITTSKFFENIALRSYERSRGLEHLSIKKNLFKQSLLEFADSRLRDEERTDLDDWRKWFTRTPDGYLIEEVDGKNVITIFEVENTNPVSKEKLEIYSETWFFFDGLGLGNWSFRLVILDYLGNERPCSLMDIWYSISYEKAAREAVS